MGLLQLTLRNVVDPVWVQMFYPADGMEAMDRHVVILYLSNPLKSMPK